MRKVLRIKTMKMLPNKYTLEKYNGPQSRHTCPRCGRHRKFSRYVNIETGYALSDEVGRCERINSCQYHKTPKMFFEEKGLSTNLYLPITQTTIRSKATSYLNKNLVSKSMSRYDGNSFITFLRKHVKEAQVKEAVSKYKIGTSTKLIGGAIFWQIDRTGKIRTGKIMQYNPETGKRLQTGQKINWVHSILKRKNFNLKQCLFGEHLLNDTKSAVMLVEAEKTAVIGSIFRPNYIWVSTGGCQNLKKETLLPLKGRKVCVFPDGDSFDKWHKIINEIRWEDTRFVVSDLIERKASESQKRAGIDLADILIPSLL